MNKIILLLLLYAPPLMALAAETAVENEWPNDPERAKIRVIVDEVERLDGANSLQQRSKQCRYGSEKFDDIGATIYKDTNGHVRKYVLDREITSLSGIAKYYYDSNGTPRFTKRIVGENYGQKNEEHIYFNEKGGHLYTDSAERNTRGSIEELPDSLPNPRDHFANLCK